MKFKLNWVIIPWYYGYILRWNPMYYDTEWWTVKKKHPYLLSCADVFRSSKIPIVPWVQILQKHVFTQILFCITLLSITPCI